MHLVRAAVAPVEVFEDLGDGRGFQGRARREGVEFKVAALEYLATSGCEILTGGHHVARYPVDGLVRVASGERLLVAAHGVFDDGPQAGLRRTDTVHKLGHRAHALRRRHAARLVVVTSHLPEPATAAARYVADLHDDLGDWLVDVIATTGDLAGHQRFTRFAHHALGLPPEPAPWWHPDPDGDTQPALRFEEGSDA